MASQQDQRILESFFEKLEAKYGIEPQEGRDGHIRWTKIFDEWDNSMSDIMQDQAPEDQKWDSWGRPINSKGELTWT